MCTDRDTCVSDEDENMMKTTSALFEQKLNVSLSSSDWAIEGVECETNFYCWDTPGLAGVTLVTLVMQVHRLK